MSTAYQMKDGSLRFDAAAWDECEDLVDVEWDTLSGFFTDQTECFSTFFKMAISNVEYDPALELGAKLCDTLKYEILHTLDALLSVVGDISFCKYKDEITHIIRDNPGKYTPMVSSEFYKKKPIELIRKQNDDSKEEN